MATKPARAKLSTTVAPENYEYLAALVKSGKASSLAEAVDVAIENLRRSQNRRRLARATAEYFDSLSPDALAEESPGPTVLRMEPGETGLPQPFYFKAHFISVIRKSDLIERLPRRLSNTQMKGIVRAINRAIDPDAPFNPSN